MFVVGITGGIGSGKSVATDYLADQGILIVDADQAARLVVQPGQPALYQIVQHFGKQVLLDDGSLNRRALREIVFADPEQRAVLERITHPAIAQAIRHQIQQSQSPYTVLVSPLLLETEQHQQADRILLIDAPTELQLQRAMQRDQADEQQIRAIMAAQMSREARRQRADDILLNNGSVTDMHRALEKLHQNYLEQARHHA